MTHDELLAVLASLAAAQPFLSAWRLRDADRGHRNLVHLRDHLSHDRLLSLWDGLNSSLPTCPDADMALNNLERFLANPDSARSLPTLLESQGRTLDLLLQLLGTSQHFSDLLSANADYLDLLGGPVPRSPTRDELQAELHRAVAASADDKAVLRAFRRFRQRQVLRVGVNDILRDRPLEEITADLSSVADAALTVATATAMHAMTTRFGLVVNAAGQPIPLAALAFGKHGGLELNYSSDIDLMFVYGEEGASRDVHGLGAEEFFSRVVSEVVRLLSAHTDRGMAYRVDLRLRPEGSRGPLARSLASTLAYYDSLGRTWERQALIKVRPVAGDLDLGTRFIQAIEPFVYRKYLSVAEINEIKALKRRIEQKVGQAGADDTEVKTGRGGIRDIEFTIQFLQLLGGGDLPSLRERNTLRALQALEKAGSLTDQEYRVLDDAYRFLRKTEHRLQTLFDLQTHRLPSRPEELTKLAQRMGYGLAVDNPAAAFIRDYRDKTEPTRRILDHLLHQTFAGEDGQAEPESDLVLDPNPEPETIAEVLGRYPFRDIPAAYQNLIQLAQESGPFLSTRRCRHFLASIAPGLLRAVADTPDPDLALLNLEKVTASLGAKAVLWELFSFNPPTLKLYVDLCAWSPFLSEILIHNPGMVDELLDSLVLNQPPTIEELRQELINLCHGAADLEPILHSFQDKELLRIGVQDILGKTSIRETTAALSDLAETILAQVAAPIWGPLVERHGEPILAQGPRAGSRSRFALLGLGKLGSRAMSYHSDLDLILVYEGDGRTARIAGGLNSAHTESTDNSLFFTELVQRIIRAASFLGPMGRLYQVDMRLRPTGKSGSLVTPLEEFTRYFRSGADGGAQLWERQALTQTRFLIGDPDFGREFLAAIEQAAYFFPWQASYIREIRGMRERLEASKSDRHIKRGQGGLVDIEFLVQALQLKHGRAVPALRQPNTWAGLEALAAAGLVSPEEQKHLANAYDFLMRVQGRLRIVHNRSLDEIPAGVEDIRKLARRLGFDKAPDASAEQAFMAKLREHTQCTRQLFKTILAREEGG